MQDQRVLDGLMNLGVVEECSGLGGLPDHHRARPDSGDLQAFDGFVVQTRALTCFCFDGGDAVVRLPFVQVKGI